MLPSNSRKSGKIPRNSKAFTLVELVVVITILAILGTIGFLSVGGYSSRARDSGRLADVANVSKSLDLSIVTVGSYPMPDGYFSVTYSGSAVWYQGTVGTTVLQAFRSSVAGGGLSKKPADPLDGGDYAYSSLAEGKAYQVMADYEGDVATSAALAPPLAETAYAAPGAPAVAYIRGNYGGIAAKVSSGTTVYVLALPSIVTNTGAAAGSSVRMDVGNSLSGTLLANGKALRNANPYNPGAAYALAYSGTKSAANPGGLPSGQAEYAALVASLKAAYSGSAELQANSAIASLLSSTGTTAMAALGSAIVSGQLGGNGGSTTTTVTCNNGYVAVNNICVIPTSCNTWKAAWNNTDGIYAIDPDGAGGNPSFSIYCDMTSDGGGWSLVYKNQGSTGLSYNMMTQQGSVSCLGNTTDNCSAKLDDTVINLIKSSSTDEIGYRTSSPSIASKYFWPGACVYRHDSYGNTFQTHPSVAYCTRYTATYTTSTSPTYIQCATWGGNGAGLNAWYGCNWNSGNYTNVSITHRGYTEIWWMTTNTGGGISGSSSTTYGNSTYMWVR